jgi:hypothetical protein
MSHVGGPVRWPADESWPVCTADLPGDGELAVAQLSGGFLAVRTPPHIGARPLPHPRPNPMMVLAQLRDIDVPDLWCPPAADLPQLLWCPFDHDQPHGSRPTVRLAWRRHDPSVPVAEPPAGVAAEEFYVPMACALHPEQVTEYPGPADLPEHLAAEVATLPGEIDYAVERSTAPGWKAGGWPDWSVAGPCPLDCGPCGTTMRLLLTIDTTEHGGGRWEPEEEKDLPRDRPVSSRPE